MPAQPEKQLIHRAILRWYGRGGRSLPWRRTRDPYRILVSEVMLQQTQAGRVLEKYPQFLRRFPSVKALANADLSDVVIAWRGMGYNNRAVRLHRLAGIVTRDHRGLIPDEPAALRALPGVGRYTANAILSSAFGKPVPVVDVNVRRVFSRMFWRMRTTHDLRPEESIWSVAGLLLPLQKSYEWNQALMDLGAIVCTARAPRCGSCPVQTHCASTGSMREATARRNKSEPSFRGIPNRIHRGRVVELLRSRGKHKPVPVDMVARRLGSADSASGNRWFQQLLQSLVKDGLIQRTGRNGISLA